MHTDIHTHIYKEIYTCIDRDTHLYTHIQTHIHIKKIYTYTHNTDTHTHTHTHTCSEHPDGRNRHTLDHKVVCCHWKLLNTTDKAEESGRVCGEYG